MQNACGMIMAETTKLKNLDHEQKYMYNVLEYDLKLVHCTH